MPCAACSGGQTSQPAGLHGRRPDTHQLEKSLQHGSTPSERCRHWLTTPASTWTHNLQLPRPRFWLHITWRTGCKCTPHEVHAGWPNLLRTPCWASLLRPITGRSGWGSS